MKVVKAATVCAAVAALVTACTSPERSSLPIVPDLTVDLLHDGVYCDGTVRPAAVLFGAAPLEPLSFTSPMPVEIEAGRADEQGSYQLQWRCEPNESRLTWEVTATGDESGRSVTFEFLGSDEDPEVQRTLTYEDRSESFSCNGLSQAVGRLGNAMPSEQVRFRAPNNPALRPGTANADGELDVQWTCRPEDADEQWTVSAIGETSGRTTQFVVEGQPAQPSVEGAIVVATIEEPFVCDGERRPVARLSNLVPDVIVDFEASPRSGFLLEGQADELGDLTVHWQCGRSQEDETWTLTADERTTVSRSATLTVTGAAGPFDPPTIAITEDPFVCDGASRQFAELSNFTPLEFIDFSSPQSDRIRQGQADEDGRLAVRWQCDGDDPGMVWEVTATGQTSEASISFTIQGSAG